MNFNDKFALDFYMKQEAKKKEMRKANDISLINTQLNRYLIQDFHQLSKMIENQEDVKTSFIHYANRAGLVQSSIFHMQYRNNFENIEIAALQYAMISYIRKQMKKSTRDIEHFRHQILNIDYGMGHQIQRHEQQVTKIDIQIISDSDE